MPKTGSGKDPLNVVDQEKIREAWSRLRNVNQVAVETGIPWRTCHRHLDKMGLLAMDKERPQINADTKRRKELTDKAIGVVLLLLYRLEEKIKKSDDMEASELLDYTRSVTNIIDKYGLKTEENESDRANKEPTKPVIEAGNPRQLADEIGKRATKLLDRLGGTERTAQPTKVLSSPSEAVASSSKPSTLTH